MEEATFSPLKWELRGKQKETRMIHMVINQCCSHQNKLIFILIHIQMEYTELFLGILMDTCQKITHISLFIFSSTEWAQKLTPQEQKYTWCQCLCFFLLFVLLCLGWGVVAVLGCAVLLVGYLGFQARTRNRTWAIAVKAE